MPVIAADKEIFRMRYIHEEIADKNDDSKLLAAVFGSSHSDSCNELFLQNKRQ